MDGGTSLRGIRFALTHVCANFQRRSIAVALALLLVAPAASEAAAAPGNVFGSSITAAAVADQCPATLDTSFAGARSSGSISTAGEVDCFTLPGAAEGDRFSIR